MRRVSAAFGFRLSREDRVVLEQLAAKEDHSLGDVLRRLIRRAAANLENPTPEEMAKESRDAG